MPPGYPSCGCQIQRWTHHWRSTYSSHQILQWPASLCVFPPQWVQGRYHRYQYPSHCAPPQTGIWRPTVCRTRGRSHRCRTAVPFVWNASAGGDTGQDGHHTCHEYKPSAGVGSEHHDLHRALHGNTPVIRKKINGWHCQGCTKWGTWRTSPPKAEPNDPINCQISIFNWKLLYQYCINLGCLW